MEHRVVKMNFYNGRKAIKDAELLALNNWGLYCKNSRVWYLVYIPTGVVGYRFRCLSKAYNRMIAFEASEKIVDEGFVKRIMKAIKII